MNVSEGYGDREDLRFISFNNPTPISMFDHRFKSFKPFHDQLIHRGKENHVYGSLFTYTDPPMHLLIILHTTPTDLVPLPKTEQESIKYHGCCG
jgi:hypothetical protein